MSTSPVHATLFVSGVARSKTALQAYIGSDGAIYSRKGSLLEDIDLSTAQWKTRRAVGAIMGDEDMTVRVSAIALVGPNGGKTDAARAIIACTEGRNAPVYTTEEIIRKGGFKVADPDALWALVQAGASVAQESEVAA